MCVVVSLSFISVVGNLKEKATVPTVSLPVSNKVIVLDAGHRKPRPEGRKVQTVCMKMI